jgi:hypothetical protein
VSSAGLSRIILLSLVVSLAPQIGAVTLVRGGVPQGSVQLSAQPSAAEKFAAEELVSYLEKISGARLPIVAGARDSDESTVVLLQIDPDLADEGWEVDAGRRRLELRGGSDRGLLYAVYHLLEDRLGVRWWTPWDEEVPTRATVRVAPRSWRGSPRFGYRDIFGLRGFPKFHLRNRLNGHYSALSPAFGGSLRFGPPFHVHTFDRLLPASKHFVSHPEWYSMRGGLRLGDETQWCLTRPSLIDAAEAALREQVERGRETAMRDGLTEPTLFDLSPNDWKNHCECGACIKAVSLYGSRGEHLVAFVAELANRLQDLAPPISLTTLAYHQTFAPSGRVVESTDSDVIVRVADLYERDFSQPLAGKRNSEVRSAVRRWSSQVQNVHYWDYRVTFDPGGDLPRADHAWIADRYRELADRGVDGLFVQTEFADVADMRDLEIWLVAKLLEDPYQGGRRLTREFLRGYYGDGWKPLQRYLRRLEREVTRHTTKMNFAPKPTDYSWLTPKFIAWAQRMFELAESRVEDDVRLKNRLLGARVGLDRATLALWRTHSDGEDFRGDLRRPEVAERYAGTRRDRIERRLTGVQAELALESLANELAWMEQAE